jgi:hypothetical protein
MKPVDLQLSVRKSQDVIEGHSTKSSAQESGLKQAALHFRKDLERRQAQVGDPDRLHQGRIEDGESGGGGQAGTGKRRRRKPDETCDDRPKDPSKGHIVDITLG